MPKEKVKRNKRIRELRKKGLSYREIGSIYGITPKTVWDIVKGFNKTNKRTPK